LADESDGFTGRDSQDRDELRLPDDRLAEPGRRARPEDRGTRCTRSPARPSIYGKTRHRDKREDENGASGFRPGSKSIRRRRMRSRREAFNSSSRHCLHTVRGGNKKSLIEEIERDDFIEGFLLEVLTMRTVKLTIRVCLILSLVYVGVFLGSRIYSDQGGTGQCNDNVKCSTAPAQQGTCGAGDTCYLSNSNSQFPTCVKGDITCVTNGSIYGSTTCVGTCKSTGNTCNVTYDHCK
jgi:hypothetical protein